MKRFVLCMLLVFAACPPVWADTRSVVTQSRTTDCGPAALATLLRYYLDVPAGESELAQMGKYRPETGTSLLGLEEAAAAKGCAAGSFLMTYTTLREQLVTYPAPVLVRLLNPEPHFALVLAIDRDGVYLADPGAGNIVLSRESFLRRWHIPGSAEGFVFVVAAPGQHVNTARLSQTLRGIRQGRQNAERARRWPVRVGL